jgi:hypothetical protein
VRGLFEVLTYHILLTDAKIGRHNFRCSDFNTFVRCLKRHSKYYAYVLDILAMEFLEILYLLRVPFSKHPKDSC